MTDAQIRVIFQAKLQGIELPPDGIYVSKASIEELRDVTNKFAYSKGHEGFHYGLKWGLFFGVAAALLIVRVAL